MEGTPQVGELSLAATTNRTNRALLEKQIRKYAGALGRSKIVLVTVSVNNYLLRKYMEVALSGALLIGDVPCELADVFRGFMVEISRSDTDESILELSLIHI